MSQTYKQRSLLEPVLYHCRWFFFTDINTKALTFLREESFLKKNYIRNIPNDVADILRNLARQNILVNLRTYDQNSLVLYVNDNLNNFIQLYVDGGMYVVFKFNDGNEIKTLRIQDPGTFDTRVTALFLRPIQEWTCRLCSVQV